MAQTLQRQGAPVNPAHQARLRQIEAVLGRRPSGLDAQVAAARQKLINWVNGLTGLETLREAAAMVRAAIAKGRARRDQWNHPTTVKRAYERAMKVAEGKEKGETVQSPVAKLKEALVEAQESAATWKRRAEEGGSRFDLLRDKPEDIARIMVESCTPSRVEKIAQALRAELRRQKQAHAG